MDFQGSRAILRCNMNPAYSRFAVTGVSFDKATGQSKLILSDQDGAVTLSFAVEPHQAGEVILHANGLASQSGDVLQLFLRAHGFRLMYARITANGEGEPRAEIHYHKQSNLFQLGLQPAQAVALSARSATPIYIDQRLVPGWVTRVSPPLRSCEEVLSIPAR